MVSPYVFACMPLLLRRMKRCLVLLCAGSLLTLAAACGGDGGDPVVNDLVTMKVPLPGEVSGAIKGGTQVLAQVYVDDRNISVDMLINTRTWQATGATNMTGEPHTVRVLFWAIGDSPVLSAEKTFTYNPDIEGYTMIPSASGYSFADTDEDGYINLVEVAFGTDPDATGSSPELEGSMGAGTVRMTAVAGTMPGPFASVAPGRATDGSEGGVVIE